MQIVEPARCLRKNCRSRVWMVRQGMSSYLMSLFKCNELAPFTSKDLYFLSFLPSSFLLHWDKILTKTKILTNKSILFIFPRNSPKITIFKKFLNKSPKISLKNPKEFLKNFRKNPKKSQTVPKKLRIPKRFPRFWNHSISYIALRGQADSLFGLVLLRMLSILRGFCENCISNVTLTFFKLTQVAWKLYILGTVFLQIVSV